MRIKYQYNKEDLKISEAPNEDDIEFNIILFKEDLKQDLIKIRDYFSSNNIVTDILVYKHPNNHYQIIVRKDFYQEFILQLFKQQLIKELSWI
jgi:hypothetical protein